MTPIKAIDEISLPAPIEDVWRVIAAIADYPRWWPTSVGVKVLSISQDLVGTEIEVSPAGGKPFRCRIAVTEPPTRMVLEYSGGLVRGNGEWRLATSENGTRLSYVIDAIADGWLMRLLGKFMDFGAIHSRQMKQVLSALEKSLAKKTL